jgi:signal transduction histidine kinase
MGVLAVFAPKPLSLATVEALGSIAYGVAAGIQRKRGEDSLRNALEKAEQSERLKSAFLANISHEVRTPLNVILGYTSLMADMEAGDDSHPLALAAIRRASDRLLSTMGAILDVSKISARAFDVTPEPIDLALAVEQRVQLCGPLAREKGLEISCTIDVRDAWIRFDAYCLSQALTHLLDNAVKFTEAGGVRVRLCREATGGCVLEIEDTGVGIDAAYLPRIFSLFTQERSGYTRPFEGAGLGLAVTRSYLEMNGASLAIDSVPGGGCCARVVFPPALITTQHVATAESARNAFPLIG